VSSLELKVPPPVLALLLAFLMWLVSSLVASLEVPFRWRAGAGLALALVGLGFSGAGVIAFRRVRTTINPHKPSAASSLVSGGVYHITRNPMYLGLLLLLLGWAAFLSNPLALLLVPVFVLYINRFQINPEERALSSLFGGEYAAYKRSVRRWI
jgi:protein-S-isoprenylcysteine O-methyltransferase Ste14